jgi:hypothetical protein
MSTLVVGESYFAEQFDGNVPIRNRHGASRCLVTFTVHISSKLSFATVSWNDY